MSEIDAKKQPDENVWMDSCLLFVTLPANAFLVLLALRVSIDALNGVFSGSPQNTGAIAVILLITTLCAALLILMTLRQIRRVIFLLNRAQGIQRERQRTAHLADTSRLELSDAEVDSIAHDENQQHQRSR